jgi:DNA-binding transcriptional LysR family regulator
MLDWDDLRTFLAISRHGTLSAAARVLKVSQTTMGRRLDRLHDRASATLLKRTPTGFQLTPTGAAILGEVERMEDAALSLERTITGEDRRLEGLVRVTTVDSLAAHLLTPAWAELQARHPGIVVEIITDTRSLSLARREADIAVRLGRFDAHETVVRKIGEMAFAVHAAPAYIDHRGLPDWAAGAPGHRIASCGCRTTCSTRPTHAGSPSERRAPNRRCWRTAARCSCAAWPRGWGSVTCLAISPPNVLVSSASIPVRR